MKIEEAIKRNEESVKSLSNHKFKKHAQALKLGNEALHRCLEMKNYTPKDTYCPLPGETE